MVFVLIPVFNRLQHTQKAIEALRAQTMVREIAIVVINDGSTDGTADYLAMQPDVVQLVGDGHLWWGGAIELGLQYVLDKAGSDDYVLFLNNDTWFAPDYVETLVRVSREGGGAAVGSAIREESGAQPLVSIGPRVDINRLAVWDVLSQVSPQEAMHPKPVYEVDALSGRGTLYPVSLFRRYGCMRPRLLPHYLADYEVAMRFRRDAQVPLLVSSQAIVFSPPVYGNDVTNLGWWDRLFSTRSSSNILRRLAFFMLVGSAAQRITAPLRMTYFAISRFGLQRLKGIRIVLKS